MFSLQSTGNFILHYTQLELLQTFLYNFPAEGNLCFVVLYLQVLPLSTHQAFAVQGHTAAQPTATSTPSLNCGIEILVF